MEAYVVGGAVRDALLGLPVSDRDWVVVGSTPEAMLAAGFRPVGKDFPVFLHPETHEEYALARTERKTAPGYHGFVVHAAPGVTLEEDLRRRDLTINAIAQAADGRLIDPWGGRRDLDARVLRHVSPAFAEDPVRILRLARFAARFPDFRVADDTAALMAAMVAAGEVDHLVPERVWQELARGLMASRPSRMLAVLQTCGAWARLLPELAADPAGACGTRLDAAAALALPLASRFALLAHDADTPEALAARLRVPNPCSDLAGLVHREAAALAAARTPAEMLDAFDRCDLWRRPDRLAAVLDLLPLLAPAADTVLLREAALRARAVDAGAVARHCQPRSAIPHALHAARLAAIGAT